MDKNMIAMVLIGVLILFVAYQFIQLGAVNKQVASANAGGSGNSNAVAKSTASAGGAYGGNSLPGQVGGC